MALQLNTQTLPLAQGIDTKSDPKQLKLGRLTSIRNLVFTELNVLSPRYGYASLTQSILNTGTISAGVTLATLNNSLVLANGTTLYSYVDSLTKWAPKGEKVAVSLSTFPVSGTAQNASVQDSARHSGGCAVYTWINSATSSGTYSIMDTNTQGTVIAEGDPFETTNMKPVVISSNSSFTVFLQNATHIQYTSVTLANPAASTAASNLVTITSGSAPFDACTGSTYAYIFYVNGSTDLAVSRIDSTNAVVNTATITGQTGTSLTCWYDSTNNYVWLAWYSGTVVKYAVYTSALVSVLATTSVVTTSSVTRLTGALTSGTTSTLYFETSGTTDADNIVNIYTITAAGTATSISTVRSLGLAAKAFTYGSVTYAVAVHDSDLQSTYFLIKPLGFDSYVQGTAVAKVAPLSAGGTPTIKTCAATYTTATGKYAFAYLLQTNPTTLSGVVQSTLTVNSAIFDFNEVPRKLALANNLHLTGGMLTNYDSGSSTEHGFNLFPEGGTEHTTLMLGGVGAGTFNWKFLYEWIDEFGQVHRSSPSSGLEITVGAIAGRASNGSTTSKADLTIESDATNPCRFVQPGATIADSFTVFASGTTISSIADANTVNLSVADAGGSFNIPVLLGTKKTFSWAAGAGYTTVPVTKPTDLYANASITSGSSEVFIAITSGLVIGQAITDNVGAIPGATTISAFVYKSNGALITLSANATATYDNILLKVTHGTGWPLTQWLHPGQVISGTGIPTNTTITSVSDTDSTVTLSEAVTAASGSFAVTDYYTVRLNLPTLRITEKGRVTQPVQISVWRTADGGTQWYKVGYAPNNTTLDTVPFYDSTSDVDLVGNTPLYTNGGEVENIAPPASDFITSYKNRIILLPSESQYQWWYSKQVVASTPVEFSDLFVQTIDQKGGVLKGAASLDDKLVFFKQRDIFYVAGDGPAPSGANNDFSYPQQITTPCGLSEPKSLVTIPTGIIFKSEKGFYLLDRGLAVSYIGAEVEDFNSYTVTSAEQMPDTTQVRFTLSSGNLVLVYDYYVGQWSVFDNINAVSATVYNSVYAYMTSAGLVKLETPGTYSDAGSVIVPSFATGWISFDKVQNYQRLWRAFLLGTYSSPHTMTMTVAQNFDDTVTQTTAATFTSSTVPYELRLPIIQQKASTHKFTFSMTPADTTGYGAAFSSIGFEMGVKTGLAKRPASQTYGGTAS